MRGGGGTTKKISSYARSQLSLHLLLLLYLSHHIPSPDFHLSLFVPSSLFRNRSSSLIKLDFCLLAHSLPSNSLLFIFFLSLSPPPPPSLRFWPNLRRFTAKAITVRTPPPQCKRQTGETEMFVWLIDVATSEKRNSRVNRQKETWRKV